MRLTASGLQIPCLWHMNRTAYGAWLGYFYYGSLIFGLIAAAFSLRHCARPWYFHSLHVLTLLYGALANIYGWQAMVTSDHWAAG